jgi:hypothetical protein
MLGMTFESESNAIRALRSLFVTWQRSDYLGADNAGLHPLLLQRTGSDGEGEQKVADIDLKAVKRVNVVKDLYSVSAWVEKRRKE